MPTNEDILRSIDAKIGALLTIAIDQYLRDTNVAKPMERSIDKMLADAGLSVGAISALLGKGERAVQVKLQAERAKKSNSSKKRK